MLTIDGSFGEGGGQIVRTSLSLSAITGAAVKIENIRAGRDRPGLRPQHVTGALAVAGICRAEVTGAEVGSRELVFRPKKVRGGTYEFDVSEIRASAGSVNLILQTILWPLAFADRKSRVVIKGGTHVPFAPTFDYIDRVFLPTASKMGLACACHLETAGYYPIGKGEVRIDIRPVDAFKPISVVEPPKPAGVDVVSVASNLPDHVARRQLDRAIERLRDLEPVGEIRRYPSPGKGTTVFVSVGSEEVAAGFQSLGALKKRAETVADEACDEFEAYLRTGQALDKHLADQLVIPMALAHGPSQFTTCEITQHLLTNISVVEKFLAVHFSVSGPMGEPGRVEARP